MTTDCIIFLKRNNYLLNKAQPAFRSNAAANASKTNASGSITTAIGAKLQTSLLFKNTSYSKLIIHQ